MKSILFRLLPGCVATLAVMLCVNWLAHAQANPSAAPAPQLAPPTAATPETASPEKKKAGKKKEETRHPEQRQGDRYVVCGSCGARIAEPRPLYVADAIDGGGYGRTVAQAGRPVERVIYVQPAGYYPGIPPQPVVQFSQAAYNAQRGIYGPIGGGCGCDTGSCAAGAQRVVYVDAGGYGR